MSSSIKNKLAKLNFTPNCPNTPRNSSLMKLDYSHTLHTTVHTRYTWLSTHLTPNCPHNSHPTVLTQCTQLSTHFTTSFSTHFTPSCPHTLHPTVLTIHIQFQVCDPVINWARAVLYPEGFKTKSWHRIPPNIQSSRPPNSKVASPLNAVWCVHTSHACRDVYGNSITMNYNEARNINIFNILHNVDYEIVISIFIYSCSWWNWWNEMVFAQIAIKKPITTWGVRANNQESNVHCQ